MLQQIISHTPAYVWAILAFLVYRGANALSDRESTLRSLFIIPGVMLYLSLDSLSSKFGLTDLSTCLWLGGAIAGALLSWSLMTGAVTVKRSAGVIVQRGSWVPLVLMLAIFVSKYVVGVLFAMRPELSRSLAATVAVCVMFGFFNGIFFGRLLRYLAAWQRAAMDTTATAV